MILIRISILRSQLLGTFRDTGEVVTGVGECLVGVCDISNTTENFEGES